MLTKALYWKWDDRYNSDKFFIGEVIDNEVFNVEIEFDKEYSGDKKWYNIKDIPFTKICINHENKITGKAFFRSGRENMNLDKLNIDGVFGKEVCEQLNNLLIETDESFEGKKLTVVFGDWILGAAFLY